MAKGGNVRKKKAKLPRRPPPAARPPPAIPKASATAPRGELTGYSHPKCYARELGDCDKQISREHYISETALEDLGPTLYVTDARRGWEGKTLTPNALCSKILCSRHNSTLSGLDVAGRDFIRALRAVEQRVARGGDVAFNGLDVERWFLKVLCGFAALEGDAVPARWLRILFDQDDLHSPAGLHLNVRVGDVMGDEKDTLRFDTARDQQDKRVGIAITLHGYRLLLGLDGKRVYDESELGKESVLRPPHLRWTHATTGASYSIILGWPAGEVGDAGLTFTWTPAS